MTAGDEIGPEVVQSTDPAGEAQIDAIIARRRAHLTRVMLAARAAIQRRDQAEAALAADDLGGTGGPGDLFGVVDTTLQNALKAAAVAIEAARSEATFVVATARAESAEELRRAGLDPAALAPVAPAPPVRAGVTPPPSARELWQSGRRTVAVAPTNGVRPHLPAAGPSASLPQWDRPPAANPVDLGRPTGPDLESTSAAAVGLLVEAPPVAVQSGVDHHQFDGFWQEADAGRRRRSRLRRRTPRGDR